MAIMAITKTQIKRLYALLPNEIKEDADLKADLIIQFTGDKDKSSTKDLNRNQADDLIHHLQNGESNSKSKSYKHYAGFNNKDKQHRYLLSLCMTIGWTVYNAKLDRMVADLERFGGWIAKNSVCKKPLKEHDTKELTALVTQFSKVVKSYSTAK